MKHIFIIFLVLVWAFIQSGCGGTSDKDTPAKRTRKKVTVQKKPKVTPAKTFKKKKKPAFVAQAAITMVDGKVYEVGSFAFYSKHRNFGGGFYTPSSGNRKWTFYLNQGALWKKIDFSDVKALVFTTNKRDYKRANIEVRKLDGSIEKGSFPFYAYKYLWAKHGRVHLAGKSKVLGRVGDFKCQLSDVLSFEKTLGGPPDAPPRFQVVYDKKEKNQATITDPGLRLIWKKSTPTYLDVYRLTSKMSVTVNNVAIKIKPQEIESVTVPQKSTMSFTVKMKVGETVKIKKFPPRVFGKLKNGDVIFADFFSRGKPVIKEVRLL
jgi:hypothetical protein